MLAFQTLEQREPFLDLLKLGRRRVDPVGIPAEEQREIFELRLDAVAGLEVGPELRFELREFGHPPPDRAQTGEDDDGRERRAIPLRPPGVKAFALPDFVRGIAVPVDYRRLEAYLMSIRDETRFAAAMIALAELRLKQAER